VREAKGANLSVVVRWREGEWGAGRGRGRGWWTVAVIFRVLGVEEGSLVVEMVAVLGMLGESSR